MEMGVGGKTWSGEFPKPVEELAAVKGPQVWLLLLPLCEMVIWHHDLRDVILVIMPNVCVLSLLLDHVTRCSLAVECRCQCPSRGNLSTLLTLLKQFISSKVHSG